MIMASRSLETAKRESEWKGDMEVWPREGHDTLRGIRHMRTARPGLRGLRSLFIVCCVCCDVQFGDGEHIIIVRRFPRIYFERF